MAHLSTHGASFVAKARQACLRGADHRESRPKFTEETLSLAAHRCLKARPGKAADRGSKRSANARSFRGAASTLLLDIKNHAEIGGFRFSVPNVEAFRRPLDADGAGEESELPARSSGDLKKAFVFA